MSFLELFILAVGLSMDAFAISICKGLTVKKSRMKYMLIAGLYFGGFQALMPFVGYLLGGYFEIFITKFDHWIAVVLLVLIGLNMVKEALGEDDGKTDESFHFKVMLPLAVATSIDALAVGITFVSLKVDITAAICLIGTVTFAFSAVGIKIGNTFGMKYRKKAEVFGGIVLIVMGIKILLSHIGVIPL